METTTIIEDTTVSLRAIRQYIFNQMLALEKGEISVDQCLSVSKSGLYAMKSYEIEIEGNKLAAQLNGATLTYTEASKQLR